MANEDDKNKFSKIGNYNTAFLDSLVKHSFSPSESTNSNVNIDLSGLNANWETDEDESGNVTVTSNTPAGDPYETHLKNQTAASIVQSNNKNNAEDGTLSEDNMDLMSKYGVKNFGSRNYSYGPINRFLRYGVSGLMKESPADYYNKKLNNAKNKEEKALYQSAKDLGITPPEGDLFENKHEIKKKLESQIDFGKSLTQYGPLQDPSKMQELIDKYGSREAYDEAMAEQNAQHILKVKDDLNPKIQEIAEGLPRLEDGSLDYNTATEQFNKKKEEIQEDVRRTKQANALDDAQEEWDAEGFNLKSMVLDFNEEGTTSALENKKVFLSEALTNAGYNDDDSGAMLDALYNQYDQTTHTGRVDLNNYLDNLIVQTEGMDTEDDTSDDVYTLAPETKTEKQEIPGGVFGKKFKDVEVSSELGNMISGYKTIQEKNQDAENKLADSKNLYNQNYDMLYEALKNANIPKDKIDELLPSKSSLVAQEDYDAAIAKLEPYIGEEKGFFGKKRSAIDEAFLNEQKGIEAKRLEEKAALDEKVKRSTARVFYDDNINQPGSQFQFNKDGDLMSFEDFYDKETINKKGGLLARLLPGGKSGKMSLADALEIDKTGKSSKYDYKLPLQKNPTVKNVSGTGTHHKTSMLNQSNKVTQGNISKSKQLLNQAKIDKIGGTGYKNATNHDKKAYEHYLNSTNSPISFDEWKEFQKKVKKNSNKKGYYNNYGGPSPSNLPT